MLREELLSGALQWQRRVKPMQNWISAGLVYREPGRSLRGCSLPAASNGLCRTRRINPALFAPRNEVLATVQQFFFQRGCRSSLLFPCICQGAFPALTFRGSPVFFLYSHPLGNWAKASL